jgi:multisubunit Na+/H+ antiporter MnhC subunit
MEAFRRTLRTVGAALFSVLIVVGAVILAFGIPVAWLWIASQFYDQSGAVTGSVAAFIFIGIVLSYSAVLLLGSWVRGRFGPGPSASDHEVHRASWNRSMRDASYRPGDHHADPVERLLVTTAIVAGIAFLIWFAFFAGAPFPGTPGGG